ncbi:uncharacterized protein TRUGW13939_08111 [Talaromyces rugulosus]|uniref:Zn(2)-C6 fungal-type domain-containing protein n=1 Tax=Talaromyces rugulosus TaxID=121627 RepID=A0A7H8R5T9_TALRU|nr:uncharacterized protein TRUGW13939_08111 [Talaromyces rugulosus]QKX60965.1 hypothetical protein TRUGW13939_08111 [Talaromyces rugulosus]
MFLTFGSSRGTDEPPCNPKHAKRSRRRSTTHACTSCRRRKIKCDGEKPCEACQWYKTPELCLYPARASSQIRLEKPATTTSNYRRTLETLFPGTVPEDLVHLSREQLLDLLTSVEPQNSNQDIHAAAPSVDTHDSTLSQEETGLESLHSMPDYELDEHDFTSNSDSIEHISDDVNALSLSALHTTSYLGVSSIQAALKVIAWLHPEFESDFPLPVHKGKSSSLSHSSPSQHFLPAAETQILDAYFVNFQPFSPLLDEREFRASHSTGLRKDDKWLALLNIVLALGTIAIAGADVHTHRPFFDRSMSHLNLSSLGNPSLEVVQALALIGGWYCHYISQPNLGYSLMGAALRMAVTLGLHREPHKYMPDPAWTAHQEHKRRIWWSLSCLEIWGHETLGRLEKENYLDILPLIENIRFVKIASKIQDSLAALPTLPYADMFDMDSQLLQWWENLPPILKDYEPYPESLYTVRTVMRWRYYNQRILLYRPSLLSFAMRQVPFMAVRTEDCTAIRKCCEIAEILIRDISLTTGLNQVVGWNAVWLLFQATMVPLICLSASTAEVDSFTSFDGCKTQVETALVTLDRMRPYGLTAARSCEVVSRLLEASLRCPPMGPTNDNFAGLGSQDFSVVNASENYQQMSQDMVFDQSANSFEDYWSYCMWQYLNLPTPNEMWPEIPNINSENEMICPLDPTGEGA